MSYPEPALARRRPASVTAAAVLMLAMALLGVVGAVVMLVTVGGIVDDFRAAAAGAARDQVNGLSTFLRTYSVLAAVLGVLGAILLAALALGNLRAVPGARIGTWVLCGLGLAVGCCGVFGVLLSGAVQLNDATAADPAVARALADAYPGWWLWVNAVVSGGQALGYIAVAGLLALPAANGYFQRTPPAQATPVWYPAAAPLSRPM
ncbi:hypothetical protein [Rhizomonospora bruguierae]|uniref:hypothetical protein n=1 Tax=Rhizomonospora bruguierae TaxID=1581705 RepID=UPI001BCFB70F|nr:hypothetical protein [Micromonospora sp. NBRC 107566]